MSDNIFENIFEKLKSKGIVPALEDCYKANYRPAFMPELVRKRIAEDTSELIWDNWWTSASLIASGKTKRGSLVKIVAHIPHAFLELAVLKDVFDNEKLIGGAGEYPKEDFHHKVALAEKGEAGVYLIPEERLKGFKSGLFPSDYALEHPLAVPIMGVSESEARKYLSKHERQFGSKIGIWYGNDLTKKPLGRLLFLSGNSYDGLSGSCALSGDGRFVGVRRASEASTGAPVGRALKKEDLIKSATEQPGQGNRQSEGLDSRIKSSLEAGRAFEYNGLMYVPVQKDKLTPS